MRISLHILTLALSLFLASNALADRRAFVWTYQYQTLMPGEAEFEQYTTLSTPHGNQFERNTAFEHQFELEVGMTPRFDFSVYQVFGQSAAGNYRYKAFKLRSRYRLGNETGDWLKPILYFEYKANQDFTAQEIEFKPIIGKQGEKYLMALNPKLAWEKEGEAEIGWGYSGAMAYKLSKVMAVGAEISGGEDETYFGPTISHGTEHLWVSLGSAFLIGKADPGQSEVKIRLLIGVGIPSGSK